MKSSWVWASLPYRVSFRVTLNSNVPIIDIMTSKLFDQKRRTTGTTINFLDRILVGKKYWNRLLRKSEQMELELHAMSPLRITKIIKYKVMTQFHSAIGPISMFVLLSLSLFLFLVDIRRLNLSNWQVIGCHITSFVEREMSLIVTVGRSAIKINVIPFVKKKWVFSVLKWKRWSVCLLFM